MKNAMQQFKTETHQYGMRFLYAAKFDSIGRVSRWVLVRCLG